MSVEITQRNYSQHTEETSLASAECYAYPTKVEDSEVFIRLP